MNIILIGFMGSGKSIVGEHLSRLLQFSWVDMDHLVYQKTGTRTMHEVFALGGELLLRETEIAIVKEYATKQRCVLSTGGGVVLNKIILDYCKQAGGKVIFLHADFALLAKRLGKDRSRPLFQDLESARKTFDFRLPLYQQYADVVVEVAGKTPHEIALAILRNVVV